MSFIFFPFFFFQFLWYYCIFLVNLDIIRNIKSKRTLLCNGRYFEASPKDRLNIVLLALFFLVASRLSSHNIVTWTIEPYMPEALLNFLFDIAICFCRNLVSTALN